MFNWFVAVVAMERVLVECSINCSLYDSRHRSIIFSLIILIVCFLSTLPGIFTVRDNLSPKLIQMIYCQDFTPVDYIINRTIKSIHLFAFFFVYIIMSIVVLIKLVRRRQRFVDNNFLFYQVSLILSKHKDFFIPYTVKKRSFKKSKKNLAAGTRFEPFMVSEKEGFV